MRNPAAPTIYRYWTLVVMLLSAYGQAADSLQLAETTATTASKATSPVTDDPKTEALMQSVDRYQKSINELQKTQGAYGEGLAEQLVGLGLAYKNLGQYPPAMAAFNRSLLVTRVNLGLYTLEQIPILEQIIATNTAAGDWTALNQNHQYLYWVYLRNYGVDDPRLLPVIDRLGYWQLHAYTYDNQAEGNNHLDQANNLFHDAIAIIESHYGPYDQRLLDPLYGIVLINYQIKATLNANFGSTPDGMSIFDDDLGTINASDIQFYINSAYRTGKEALLRIIDIQAHNQDLAPSAAGIGLVHLGDWDLLFDRRDAANKTYAQACAQLATSGMAKAEIDQLFAQPRSLPALPGPQPGTGEPAQQAMGGTYVLARFDVPPSGRPTNIEIIEANPVDNKVMLRRARQRIRATRFRPRLEDGQPIATTNVSIRYEFQE